MCICPSVSVCRCPGTGVRMWRPKVGLPLLLSPLLLETVSVSLTELRTQHSSRLPGQSASPGEPSASAVSVLGLHACTRETICARDQIQNQHLAMEPSSQPQHHFITSPHNNQVIWIILADRLLVAAQTPKHPLNPIYTDLLPRVRDGCEVNKRQRT